MSLRVRPKKWWELVALGTTRAFTTIGVLATAVQTSVAVIPGAEETLRNNWGYLLLSTAVIALAMGATRCFQPGHVMFRARGTDLELHIKEGNLFDETANIAIPVNDFFDTSLGRVISANSVHGQLVARVFASDPQAAQQAVEASLAGKQPTETVARSVGNVHRYKIGETALIANRGHHFILFALGHTDPQTHEVGATPDQLVTALVALWSEVRACCNHDPISVPLIGAGASRTGLSKAALIDFALATAIRAHKTKPIAKRLSIVLRPEDLNEIDLSDLKRRYE